jgi:hypothetical protein
MITICDRGIYINKILYKFYRDIPIVVLDQLTQHDLKQVEFWFMQHSSGDKANVLRFQVDRNR